jgi:exodeoxyribonuclease V beta subunit
VTTPADRPGGPEGRDPEQFDLCGPLPGAGVTLLEASAGTGKTYTIAGLVTRVVAEGTPIDQVLAVTFTRMATGELRDRIRARLVAAESALGLWLQDGPSSPVADPLVGLLASGTPAVVARRRDRLATALTSFDEATITTTHGFCQLMLAGLGVDGDVTTGATLLEDSSDLVEQVVDDLYVRWTFTHGDPPSFDRPQALKIAREAIDNPVTPLVAEPEGSPAALRQRFADSVRRETRSRLLHGNLLTFDDMLLRLERTLRDPRRGETACERLRARYSVVLVDEFQDTDPVQWDVIHAAFGSGGTTLVLIGDPKQAIYSFRGADLYAYLGAARSATYRFTLGENWRSDAGLLAAIDALLDPLRLGHPDIPFRPVYATPGHRQPGLKGAPVEAPLRVRLVSRRCGARQTAKGALYKEAAVEFIARDLSADVVSLLESGAELIDHVDDAFEDRRRPLGPGDVAVLVRTNNQAHIVLDALRAADVPAVVACSENVFTTPAAQEWLALLEAMEQPASRSRAVAVALGPFFGMSADDVVAAGEPEWEQVHTHLHRWSAVLRQRGVAPLFRAVMEDAGVPGRLLLTRDGDRRLTDLGHIAQLLHVEASTGRQGPPPLRAWLASRIDEARTRREGEEAEEQSRWIDSDANAVQVLTVHRAKGLEFPVVYCPFLWETTVSQTGDPVVFHDPVDGWERKLDVSGGDGDANYLRHFKHARDEERGEALRHLYVALTRAKHQVVCWWAPVQHSNHSSLGRLLLARDGEGNVTPEGPRQLPDDETVRGRFEVAAERTPGLLRVEDATGAGTPPPRWSGRSPRPIGRLAVASFDRALDRAWRRASYTSITAAAHGGPIVGSDPEEAGTVDEPLAGSPAELVIGATADGLDADGEVALRNVRSPWAQVPAGVEIGTLVHRVLEEITFTAEDLDAEIGRALVAVRPEAASGAVPEGLGEALRASVTTPLGSLVDGIALREVATTDRLNELGLELPIAGGDARGRAAPVTMSDIAALFERHVSGPDAPLAGYAARLLDPLLATDVRGYLTGSIDLVFRTIVEGAPRYIVVDYKTNWIGTRDDDLTAWHYRPAALDATMQRMHYPLQAIFYLVALHRYLRWRLPGYEPDVNLGGVLYLFLRGMAGPATPVVDGAPCGVFSWRPPVSLVTEMSDLFGGES